MNDDKRLLASSPEIEVERESEHEWHYCKYCYRDTPTFILTEAWWPVGQTSANRVAKMRCCWECGSGLERLDGVAAGKEDR
jgi:hypothetical protein